ncbi:MAG: GAF domain-containing protein [Armatimonadota bacterium]
MPAPQTSGSVLSRIAQAAASGGSASECLEQVLNAAREALDIGALCVVAAMPGSDQPRIWLSSADGFDPDVRLAEQDALDAPAEGKVKLSSGRFVVPLEGMEGCHAALVGQGAPDGASDSWLLEAAAAYLSLLVRNERLSQALDASNQLSNRRMEEIAAIYEIGQAVDATDPAPVLDLIVAKAAALMEAQTCSLMLADEHDGALVIAASYGLDDDIVKGTRIAFGEGIAGRVAATGEPVLIDDVAADPRFSNKVSARSGVSGSMCVPLRDENGVVRGVLSIRRHVPNPPFTPSDLKLFCVFATHAALALTNAQLYARLQQKVQEMATISGVLHAINSTLDYELVLQQIVESITGVVGFDRCCLYLLDTRTNELVAGARKGYRKDDVLIDRIKPGEGVIGLAAKEQIPIFCRESPTQPGSSPCHPVRVDAAKGPVEFLAAPILVRDSCIGVVVVDNCIRGRPIEQRHVELLSTFVSQAGIAVENARLYEAMEQKYAELNALYEHSRAISAAYGVENAAEVLVSTASRALRCDGAGLLLLDNKRGQMRLVGASGGMVRTAEQVDRVAFLERSVNFVRELRGPVVLETDDPQVASGENAELLRALAPARSNLLLAPLIAENATVGVLALYRRRAEAFQGAEVKLISILTSHAANVLRNAIAYEQKMRQRVLELTALYEFSRQISSAATLEDALDSILAMVAGMVDFDESFIYAVDHERGVAAVRACRFRGEARPTPPEEILDGPSVISWAIRERKALVSPDITRDPRFAEVARRRSHVRSLMSIPLIVQDEVVGVLSVHSESPNQYSEDEVRVLSIIASQGAAIYKELEALSALTTYTDNILSSIAAGVATLDSDGVVLTWNRSAERIVGLKAERVVGLDYEQVLGRLPITEPDRELIRTAIEGVFETGETYQGYKLRFHPRNRPDVFINMSISLLQNSAGEQLGLVLIFEDISREIRMEEEFRRMGELAAIGQLAASIAHELRNPLSSIKGAAQFLQKEYEDHSSIVEFLSIIVEEVNGLNKLTTEFLDFARPVRLELKPVSLNKLVEKTLQLMSVHITDSNVVVKELLYEALPTVQADPEQLEQVLKNIFINALQAMPDGGVLTVETGPAASGGVWVSVTDTGIGIPPDKIDRIFQPFVTTKTKGTGLGLSVVRKIVENHGGTIEVTSEVGKGSTFKIILPKMPTRTDIDAHFDPTLERRTSGQPHSA